MNESLLSSGLQSETMNYWIEKFRKEYQELRLPKDYSAQGNEKGEYLLTYQPNYRRKSCGSGKIRI